MNLEVKKEQDVLFVKPIEKSIEAENSKEFKVKMIDLINQENKNFLLNLSEVEFIDSNALGSLISILKALSNVKGQIVIYGVKEPVLRILNLTRLNQVFPIFSNEKEAVAFLKMRNHS